MPSTHFEVTESTGQKDLATNKLLIHNPEEQLSQKGQALLARPKKHYTETGWHDGLQRGRL